MPEATDPDAWFEGELKDVLDCLRLDLLQAVLDLLSGELSLRRIGLEERIGTGVLPEVFVAPSLEFRSSQVIERRSVRNWLVRFLRGSSSNRYAALRVRANLVAAPGEPSAEEDLAFQIRQPSFIRHRGDRVAEIRLASGQRLTVTEPGNENGRHTWRLDDVTLRKGLPMEGVALLTETLIRWRIGQDDRDLRTIRASDLAAVGTPLAALLHVFASGISDVGAVLRNAHRAGSIGPLASATTPVGTQMGQRAKRWKKAEEQFTKELQRIERDWHPELGCRFQFRSWRSRMLVDLDRSLAPVERGGAGERLQVDFEAQRKAGGPIRLSYFLPDVLSDGDFLRSVAARMISSVDTIRDYPTNADARNSIKQMLRNAMKHIDAGRVRLLRISIGDQEEADGTTVDRNILIIAREKQVMRIRQVFFLLDVRAGRHPSASPVSVENIRLIGMLRTGNDGVETFRTMIDEQARNAGRDTNQSNFRKVGARAPDLFRKGDEVHDYFARLITVMHRWQILIDDLGETQA